MLYTCSFVVSVSAVNWRQWVNFTVLNLCVKLIWWCYVLCYMYCPAWQMSMSKVQSSIRAAKQIKLSLLLSLPVITRYERVLASPSEWELEWASLCSYCLPSRNTMCSAAQSSLSPCCTLSHVSWRAVSVELMLINSNYMLHSKLQLPVSGLDMNTSSAASTLIPRWWWWLIHTNHTACMPHIAQIYLQQNLIALKPGLATTVPFSHEMNPTCFVYVGGFFQ